MSGPLKPGPKGKVALLAPYQFHTGGPESTHQLAAILRHKIDLDASMLYVKPRNQVGFEIERGGCHPNYTYFNLPDTDVFEDREENVIIFPQIWASGALAIKKAKVGVWWLGLDSSKKTPEEYFGTTDIPVGIMHICQSHYAADFLLNNGIFSRHIYMLTDHIRPRTPQELDGGGGFAERHYAITYNPAKGLETTKKIMIRAIERGLLVPWFPISRLTPSEVREQFRRVRLYVDFGEHPGMDKLPREAALAGACVITGRQGSAGFVDDVPIPEEFRIPDHLQDPPFLDTVVDRITDVLNSEYKTVSARFEGYRKWILRQPELMEKQARELFT